MKKFFATAAIAMVFCSTQLYAQQLRINAYSGYSFNDRVSTYYNNMDYYEGTIKGGYRWGAGAEYLLNERYGVELTYHRQDTKAPVKYYNIVERRNTLDLAVNWITLAGTHYIKGNDKFEPYGGLLAGAAIFNVSNPDNQRSASTTRFAWGARLGTNVFFSETVGLKLQTDLMSAVQSIGGGVYFGTGGSGTAVSTYSTMLQFHLGGGLVFRLKPKFQKK